MVSIFCYNKAYGRNSFICDGSGDAKASWRAQVLIARKLFGQNLQTTKEEPGTKMSVNLEKKVDRSLLHVLERAHTADFSLFKAEVGWT